MARGGSNEHFLRILFWHNIKHVALNFHFKMSHKCFQKALKQREKQKPQNNNQKRIKISNQSKPNIRFNSMGLKKGKT